MKRYWLFMNSAFYPNGGMRDFAESFDSVNEAVGYFREASSNVEFGGYDWYEVFDSHDGLIVDNFGSTCYDDYSNENIL